MSGKKTKVLTIIAALAVAVSALLGVIVPQPQQAVAAVGTDYAPQLMNLSLYDDSKNLTAAATVDKTAVSLATEDGALQEQWRIDYCGADSNGNYYKIVHAASGRLLTPYGYTAASGSQVVIFGNENDKSQYWYILPVSKDSHGNNLHYQIVNYANPTMALTSQTGGAALTEYSGSNAQKWLLNCAGLQGFAGYCANDNEGNIKAGDIGGLLGETVTASSFAELKQYAESDTPYTIVVTSNISVSNLTTDSSGHYYCPEGRIYLHSNKTIIGSYSAHTLYNVQFCTASSKGVGNNIIIRNFEMQHAEKSNGNDSIVVYFGSGQNLWVDHVTFTGHSAVNTQGESLPDWDKFLACCYDADYCTVSDCSFGLHEYGVILGYPADDASSYENYNNFPRMSLICNRFKDTVTRGPGLMRYGYYHSLNNYVYNFSMAYTVHTASKIYAENCYYDGAATKGNVICDWNSVTYPGSYDESGSKFVNCNRTTIEGYAQICTWRPNTNYRYETMTADQAKTYCEENSGAQNAASQMNYSTYAAVGVPSAGLMVGPNEGWSAAAAVVPSNAYFMLKNAASGLYLDVEGANAGNSVNVQQWGASEAGIQNTWRFVTSEEEGYYYLQSMVGDKTYVMDLAGGKTENGTNIAIYHYQGNDNQKFMLTENADGSYRILPKNADGTAFLEIAAASADAGANCRIWENTGSACQNWILEEVSFSGEIMDTTLQYQFRNANSDLYMEVADASDKDGANVQQWEANGSGENQSADWNTWTLKKATGDLYYIVSNLEGNRYLTVNNDNAEIASRNTAVNTQMMRFVKNPDGTYLIVTRTAYDGSSGRYTKGLEVADAAQTVGATIRQWTLNGNSCQNWAVEAMTKPVVTTTTTTTTTTTKATTTTAKSTESTSATTSTSVTDTVETPSGDVNADGQFTVADVVLLQKWLLGERVTLADWHAGDLYTDNLLNGFDLCIMRTMLIQ